MSWRVKQFLRKWTPIALIAVGAWVGFTHWQRGGRATVGSVMTSARVAAIRTPILGSYFKNTRRHSYAPARRGRGKSFAYGRRGHRRYGHASRRHPRRGRRR